jgi:hypothetical protein
MYMERGAEGGALEVDVLRHREVQHGIESIEALISEAIPSYDVLGSPLSTLSVSREAADISTQQINRVKAAQSIDSIQPMGNDQVLITLTGTTLLDADYLVGKQVVVSSASNASNDGTFTILAVNINELPSVLVTNASGVEQSSPAGNLDLNLFEYVYNSSVDPDFAAGEAVLFGSHTDSNNNGIKDILRTNDGGNNIICYVENGSTQAGVAGGGACLRMRYTFASAVDTENYVPGELADFGGHSSANNNGLHEIIAVNVSGNNVVVLNRTTGGAIQAGAGGTTNTRRQVIGLTTDPAGIIEVGDQVLVSGRSGIHPTQDGAFDVKLVKKFGANNIVIYLGTANNSSGAGGNVASDRKRVSFREDFSASYTVDESLVSLEGIAQGDEIFEHPVVEINRVGGTNFNVIIKAVNLTDQVPAAGRVAREVRTIFSTRPRLEFTLNKPRKLQADTGAVFNSTTIEANDILSMDILEVPEGLPSTMVLSLS